MPELSVARLKQTRAAQRFKHSRAGQSLLRRVGRIGPPPPLLSVVVPIYDAAPYLERCLGDLLAQTYPSLEIVLVDDGSTDGSAQIAQRYAAEHQRISFVRQEHAGVGAARNAGAQRATGTYLAFCDADDVLPHDTYERMCASLEESGSDLVVGSVAVQHYGQFREPRWARRSNAERRLGVTVDDVPAIVANLLPGARVFRRTFWNQHLLTFPTDAERADETLVVQTLLSAGALDVLPGVVYQWRWREDGHSLRQRYLRDKQQAARRVGGLRRAGELVVHEATEQVQQHYFAEILHSDISDLVRAAVYRDDGHWESLSPELRRLMGMVPASTLKWVPVEDRLTAWLCAHDERTVAEEFLEYAWDNKFGYPHRFVDGSAFVELPFIDAIPEVDDELVRVADAEMVYRTRMTRLCWQSPTVLRVEGAAYVEYVDDAAGPSQVDLVLRDRNSGAEVVLATTAPAETWVNEWSERAQEDHRGGAFCADIDVDSLRAVVPDAELLHFDVSVRLQVAGLVRVASLQSRQAYGSASLLEVSSHGGWQAEPVWLPFQGLGLDIRPAARRSGRQQPPAGAISVDHVAGDNDVVELIGDVKEHEGAEIAIVGPRSRTDWVRLEAQDGRFHVGISVLVDEWGLGTRSLPIDVYRVMARLPGGPETPVQISRELWRRLPLVIESGLWHLIPNVVDGDSLALRIQPREVRTSRPPFHRRRLREQVYPAARQEPVLPTALFETFAGKAAGDNPGPLCEELARRGELDLAFSVVDHSVAVPEGARSVVRWSPEWFELLGRAQYLIVNASLPYFFSKRDEQVLVQTWHGSPLKKIAHDRPIRDFDNWHHRRQLRKATPGWDYLLSQSEFCTRALRRAFRYEGDILELGYPRNDVLSSDAAALVRRRTRRLFGLTDDQRVVLYAPTWRDNVRTGMVFDKVLYLDTEAVVRQLDDTVILVRGHYNSIGAAESKDPDGRIIDVTRYPDISHLYLAADALVTDYSSAFFDFSITDKPMAFLAPDLEHYRDENRGFYLDYHDLVPGPVCEDTDDVVRVLVGPDTYAERRATFREQYAPLDDGHAAKRVIDAVFGSW